MLEEVCIEGFSIITRLSDSLEASTVNDARNLALVLLEDLLERCPVPDVYVVPEQFWFPGHSSAYSTHGSQRRAGRRAHCGQGDATTHTCWIFLPEISDVRSRLLGQELLKLSTMMTCERHQLVSGNPRAWSSAGRRGGRSLRQHPKPKIPHARACNSPRTLLREARRYSEFRCTQHRP